MNVLDNIYRIFMFILPFTVCIAAYVWIGKKAWRVSQQASRIIALLVIAGGLGYTLYRMEKLVGDFFSNDNFEFIVIIVMVVVLAVASIVMAIGEPEEENKKEVFPAKISDNKQSTTNNEGKEAGTGQ